jgi:hypothetical protein
MCLTPIVEYVPRPVKAATRPEGAQPSLAEHDHNLYGPKPVPPSWDTESQVPVNSETHTHSSSVADVGSATAAIAAAVDAPIGGTRLQSTIVELPSGRRLLITEL